MIKMTCDRCGRGLDPKAFNLMTGLFGEPQRECKWKPTMLICGTDPKTAEYRRFELCEECENKLHHFIFDEVINA